MVYAAIPPDSAKTRVEPAGPGDRTRKLLFGRIAVLRVQAVFPNVVGYGRDSRINIEKPPRPAIPVHRVIEDVPFPDADTAAIGGQFRPCVRLLQGEVFGLLLGNIP